MKDDDKVPYFYVWLFSCIMLVTGIIPLAVGGIVPVIIWVSPIGFMENLWRRKKFHQFPCYVAVMWLMAVLVGAFVSGTFLDIRVPWHN